MKKLPHLLTGLAAAAVLLGSAHAAGPFRNPDNKSLADVSEGTYPIPYKMPVAAEITDALNRIRGYLESTTPTRVVNKKTGAAITDFSKPVADAIFEPSAGDYGIMVYEMGLVHSALLKVADATGEPRYTAMTGRHLQFFKDQQAYFAEQEKQFKLERNNSFARFLDPRSLDDAGSYCAALMRARHAKIGPDLSGMIATCSDYVANKQFRLADGTLARKRPQAVSLWADDMYMGIPALAEMGRMTGQRKYFDDAVNNVLNMTRYMFNPQLGIYTHGWHQNLQDGPRFYWSRANGWAVMAMSDVLDVLPKDHPGYEPVLNQLRATLKGVAERQSGAGLWHQMIDRNDSYLETSASAMFTYVIAHAVNQGWVSPTTYGSIAQTGWQALSQKITAKGEIEGICVGTTLAGDQTYYYNRPTSTHALHGYGPTLMAGAEVLKMIKNPNLNVEYRVRTYHYQPKSADATDYREHN